MKSIHPLLENSDRRRRGSLKAKIDSRKRTLDERFEPHGSVPDGRPPAVDSRSLAITRTADSALGDRSDPLKAPGRPCRKLCALPTGTCPLAKPAVAPSSHAASMQAVVHSCARCWDIGMVGDGPLPGVAAMLFSCCLAAWPGCPKQW